MCIGQQFPNWPGGTIRAQTGGTVARTNKKKYIFIYNNLTSSGNSTGCTIGVCVFFLSVNSFSTRVLAPDVNIIFEVEILSS